MYQIYPRSFYDTNNDGIGDLPGIIKKLDYLNDGTEKSLGVEAIWLSPIYRSPQVDFGYDVANYNDIDPIFGTLSDFDRLVEEAHARGMKVIMDFVPNHTSIEHPWFAESRASKDSVKRDWYIWRDPKPNGGPPNNWLSVFGGPAWELDKQTGQYYLHSFFREQPDLNWRNEEVRKEMLNVLEFWLHRGVDGFRTDSIHHLTKDSKFRDDPPNPNYKPGNSDPYDALLHIHSLGYDEPLDNINAMCEILGLHDNKFLVSEAYLDIPEMTRLYGACQNNLHAPFNFNLMTMPWSALKFREFIDKFETSLLQDDWPTYVMGNHDRLRIATRLGQSRAKLIAMLLLTLRGMPLIYYGDELGMECVDISPEKILDPFEKNVPGMNFGRDPERTPMQWSGATHAGFSKRNPWLPVEKEFKKRNVTGESRSSKSTFNLYRKLIWFRKSSKALLRGKYQSFDCGNQDIFSYKRTVEDEEVTVFLNFSGQDQKLNYALAGVKLVCNTDSETRANEDFKSAELILKPYEGYVFTV